ncbi:hypothetical protein Cmtc_18600 [Cupriavidus sp. TKC]|uniref:hypothetical protein n=1 Tax=Cupriavidus sp. TKC TaxID=2880159 RepID=UPI0025A8295D|nr:hypothetical protein [Cupriavidus sp. TKC]GMG90640.1 hypothetical protein Cmtc_18600 [Cupriavidus sp. TKC]
MADSAVVAWGGLILGAIGTAISCYNWYIARLDRRERLTLEIDGAECHARNLSPFPIQIVKAAIFFSGGREHCQLIQVPYIIEARATTTLPLPVSFTITAQISQMEIQITTGTGRQFTMKAQPPAVEL